MKGGYEIVGVVPKQSVVVELHWSLVEMVENLCKACEHDDRFGNADRAIQSLGEKLGRARLAMWEGVEVPGIDVLDPDWLMDAA